MNDQHNKDEPLVSALFDGLRDFLNQPLPGTSANNPKPQQTNVEDHDLLDKIKDILNSPLPGTRSDSENSNDRTLVDFEAAPASTENQVNNTQATSQNSEAMSWNKLSDIHHQQREKMRERHDREWEALRVQHEQARNEVREARRAS